MASRPRIPESRFLPAELADVSQDLVQAMAGDVLHRVIADAVMHAVVEDAYDVGVVQPGRRAGLGAEPAQIVVAVRNWGCMTLSATWQRSDSRTAS